MLNKLVILRAPGLYVESDTTDSPREMLKFVDLHQKSNVEFG